MPSGVGIGAVGAKKGEEIGVAASGGQVQRGVAALIDAIGIGAELKKGFGGSVGAGLGGDGQGRGGAAKTGGIVGEARARVLQPGAGLDKKLQELGLVPLGRQARGARRGVGVAVVA